MVFVTGFIALQLPFTHDIVAIVTYQRCTDGIRIKPQVSPHFPTSHAHLKQLKSPLKVLQCNT